MEAQVTDLIFIISVAPKLQDAVLPSPDWPRAVIVYAFVTGLWAIVLPFLATVLTTVNKTVHTTSSVRPILELLYVTELVPFPPLVLYPSTPVLIALPVCQIWTSLRSWKFPAPPVLIVNAPPVGVKEADLLI